MLQVKNQMLELKTLLEKVNLMKKRSCHLQTKFTNRVLSAGLTVTILAAHTSLLGDATPPAIQPQATATSQQTTIEFAPFTGRVTANKVRLRLQPSLDGQIYKELDAGELFVVTGIHDDFYAVIPPSDVKGYLFRTYVLEGVVEGQNVNLRLEPDTNAPILTQLHAGDKVEGVVSPKNSKWLEVSLPAQVRFYIAKDYIEKAGDKNYLQKIETERKKLQSAIAEMRLELQKELAKPFRDIQLAPLAAKIHSLQRLAADYPREKESADQLFQDMQNDYLQLSLVQESRPIDVPDLQPTSHQAPKSEAAASSIQNGSPKHNAKEGAANRETEHPKSAISPLLQKQEQQLVAAALAAKIAPTEETFYQQELHKARTLRGTIVRYDKVMKGRPGDFMLVDTPSNVPIAFLYSTQLDLTSYEGKAVRLKASSRPNNNFALPAYFVLEAIETTKES